MEFALIKNPDRVREIQSRLSSDYQNNIARFGETVSYITHYRGEIFPQILNSISNSKRDNIFIHAYYYFRSKESTLEDILPAPFFFHSQLISMNSHYSSIVFSYNQCNSILKQIYGAWERSRVRNPSTGQLSISLGDAISTLKMSFGSFLFFVRALLDSIAAKIQYLNGPQSLQFRSFSNYKKSVLTDKIDNELKPALSDMRWFDTLRDYRDHTTHMGAIDISLYHKNESLKMVVGKSEELPALLANVFKGLNHFLEQFDNYYGRKILLQAETLEPKDRGQ